MQFVHALSLWVGSNFRSPGARPWASRPYLDDRARRDLPVRNTIGPNRSPGRRSTLTSRRWYNLLEIVTT